MTEGSIAESWRRSPASLTRVRRLASTRRAPLLLVSSVAIGAVILLGRLTDGWFRHDDGSLAHEAQRVLAGELPHRDFVDLYTGLLSFVNAGVFAVLGEDVANLRIPLFLGFLAFLAAFFALARRWLGPGWAFVATTFAIGWSVPVYPAPMPSWYLLFLSTIGLWATVRYFERGGPGWLVVSGACGGLAIAIKIVGVWYVAGVVLALMAAPLVGRGERVVATGRSRQHAATLTLATLLSLALAVGVMASYLGQGEVAGLLVPIALLCGALVTLAVREWRGSAGVAVEGLRAELGWFATGVALPLLVFAIPYVATGSLSDLARGVLVEPKSRFEFASFPMPAALSLLWALPVVAVFVLRVRLDRRGRQLVDVCASAVLVVLIATAGTWPSYQILWNMSRALGPAVIIVGACALVVRRSAQGSEARSLTVMVLVAGFSTMLQFPFASPVYYCYVVPLLLLAAIAGLHRLGALNGLLPAALLIALTIFGLRQLDHQSVVTLGFGYRADDNTVLLDSSRARIRVPEQTERAYARVRRLVLSHEVPGRPIFAGPDAPEIYFLTETRNATPSILDFLDSSGSTHGTRLTTMLREEHVPVVVLNHQPLQSPKLDIATVRRIRSMYPGEARIGRFEIRWTQSQ